MIGMEKDENKIPLLPICHTTQKAQIEIIIDGRGNFKDARVIPKNEARTIIPSTERAAGRTHINAHALCDKLQYVAKDYHEYGGKKKPGYERNPREKNEDETYYYEQLNEWCSSKDKHPKAIAVFKYVHKGTIISDLIKKSVLIPNKRGKLLEKWDKQNGKEVPDIFKVIGEQAEAFVRWQVAIPDDPCSKTWEDRTLWESWTKFYTSTKKIKSVCYVTGKEQFMADQHPKKIRNDGDGAKLISSNDSNGFTFRGRFLSADQACGVGFAITQKAHSALRWLISRQGYKRGDQAIVAWATSGAEIPDPLADPYSLLGDELQSDQPATASTAQELALKLKNRIAGYGKKLVNTSDVVVMGIDSATPGRMAVTYYRELTKSDFLHRIDQWHETCTWIHNYHGKEVEDSKTGKKKKIYLPFVGAPAPADLAEVAYGRRLDDKLRNATVERILPCIIDGQQIPRDIVESVVRRASHRVGMDNWEWNKTMSIACALYKKYNEMEKYDMALDLNRKTRDYLYGRLLAIADRLEGYALYKTKEKRDTNAARYMQQFAERPYKTWKVIELSLSPYKSKLGGANFYISLIDEVMCKFEPIEDFTNDKPLTGEFLIGYHCQRAQLMKKRPEGTDPIDDENIEIPEEEQS
jgi:CRISPR-associated protein Csd1